MTKNYWAGMGALTVLQQKEEGWHIGGAGLQLCDAGPAALKILCWKPTVCIGEDFLTAKSSPFSANIKVCQVD